MLRATLAVSWFMVMFAADAAPFAEVGAGRAASLDPLPAAEFTLEHARHLLMRAGFGGTLEEVQRLHRLGLEGAVQWLVDYEDKPDVVGGLLLRPSERSRADFRRLPEEERRRLQQQLRREDQQRFARLRRWWMDRLVGTRRPLEESMTLFWHGHFTTSYRDVRSAIQLQMQNDLLRRHATGNFGDLLHAISKDPAMLRYLNNNQNRRGRPNENYAREVMELFTLGIGNYTEADIKEAARSFTGFTSGRGGRFVFNRAQHDPGVKTLFGKSGRFHGDDVCDLLLAHEACASFVASKVFAWLAYDDVEPELRAELGRTLRSFRYELKPLLRRILGSRAFYSKKAMATKVKSPTALLVSTVRMLGLNPPPSDVLLAGAQRLGQNLLQPPNVKGWEGGMAWITTATLLDRNNLCGMLVGAEMTPSDRAPMQDRRRRPGAQGMRGRGAGALAGRGWDRGLRVADLARVLEPSDGAALVDGLCKRLLFVPLRAATRQELVDFVSGADGSTPLDLERLGSGAAEAKLRKLLHLIMSTPEFQVC